ncbi:hypothetical protein VB779_09355 [Haloarculaceae archaeon H-GB11]|nr:hypothetical protein [Haloarculaceae archaeon H-GB11]
MGLTEYLRHPASMATAVVGFTASILHFPFVWDLGGWLVGSAGTLFTGVSVFAFTVAPEVAWLDAELLKPIAIGLGVIFGLSKLYSAGKNLTNSVDE